MLLKLAELGKTNRSERVQLAKIGTFTHEEYGIFSISGYDLERMKQLFEANIRKQQIDSRPVLPFDYRHDTEDKAAGWIDSLSIENDNNDILSLFGSVEWTPPAAEKIRDKEFKFVSPDIRRNYRDRETGQVFDIVLMGAALTNVPFLRDMEAVFLFSEEKQAAYMALKLSGDKPGKNLNLNKGANMPIEDIMSAIAQMSPDDKKRVFETLAKEIESSVLAENQQLSEKLKKAETDLEKAESDLKLAEEKAENATGNNSDFEKKLNLSEKKVDDLAGKVESLTSKLAENQREAEFNGMLSEGKVCEAQRVPFMKSDFAEFAEKAEPLNLTEGGHGDDVDSDTNDVQEKVEKLAEKKMEADKDLDFGGAVSLVLLENKELAKAYNG